MHHGTCLTHVPWCMSGSLTCGDGENVPGIPGACAPAILRIWQEAHYIKWKLVPRFRSLWPHHTKIIMNKWLHPLLSVGWNYLFIFNLQRRNGWSWEWISNLIPHFTGSWLFIQGLKLTLIPWSDFLLLLSKSRSKSDHHRSYFLSLKADIWLDWVAKLCS